MIGNGNGRLGEAEYAELVTRIQSVAVAALPPGASVLVTSKGDPALLEMPGLGTAHFPQDGNGGYAGHHPVDSAAAIAELESRRRRGAEYLVIPSTARWWLDHYGELATHLATHAELVADEEPCLIYGLGAPIAAAAESWAMAKPRATLDQLRDYLECLLPAGAGLAVLDAGGVAAPLAPLLAVPVGLAEERRAEPLLAELRRLAADGFDYLVVPRAADESLDREGELGAAIETSCRKLADQRHLCRVFDLDGLREETG